MRLVQLLGKILWRQVVLAVAAMGLAGIAHADELAAHRAIYDLSLAKMKIADGPDSVRGRILYDFGGNACDGYTLQFRQVSELSGNDKAVVLSDLRSSSWESADGSAYRFSSQNMLGERVVESAEGSARREGGDLLVTLAKPTVRTIRLDGAAVFPTDQLRRIIIAAREGKTLLELPVYDGSDNGEKIYQTLSIIGARIEPAAKPPTDAAKDQSTLGALARWPVTISYFDRDKATGEQLPVYGLAFELYENGLARGLTLDYPKFTLTGALASLDLPAAKPCR